jgi:MarR family transcriptional regulator, transcriptional regulator for hemolysin
MQMSYDLFNLISVIQRQVMNHSNKHLDTYDLSLSYWRVLRVLKHEGPKKFGEMTTILQIEKPALTKIIKKLVERNFVEVQIGLDKRQKHINLTTEGRVLLEDMRKDLDPFLKHAFTNIQEEQLIETLSTLMMIQKNMKTYQA